MKAQDCLDILREIKDVAFATVDESGFPQNRIIDVMLTDDEKLYFCTSRGKDFHRQLTRDPRVAVTSVDKSWRMVRLMGRAVRLEDQKHWIDRIFEENPSMNGVYPGQSRYILDAFCISAGELEYFDLSSEPITRRALSFGGAEERQSGFVITDSCISCGTCAGGCPQQCIKEGAPYEIDQPHCLHCGLCAENCPAGAVERRGEK